MERAAILAALSVFLDIDKNTASVGAMFSQVMPVK
jgi:hypothetical protein